MHICTYVHKMEKDLRMYVYTLKKRVCVKVIIAHDDELNDNDLSHWKQGNPHYALPIRSY